VHDTASAYRLVVLGDGSVKTIPLVGTNWVLGRSPECSIQLRDPTVSRRHLRIDREGDEFRFQDLGGSNPILLDGRPTRQGDLVPGQTIVIGLTRITLERRQRAAVVVPKTDATVVLSREVIDEELEVAASASSNSHASVARRVLERIEWTFAEVGSLPDAAEPMLDMALNLTGRRRGMIGRFTQRGGLETLAALDAFGADVQVQVPEHTLLEGRRLARANLLTVQEDGRSVNRLIVPLGNGPEGIDGIMVLEEPLPEAGQGQDLLRLARSLGVVVWCRLQEVAERLRLRDEVQRLRFHGTTAHNALMASTRLQALRQQLREVANSEDAVLLVGEDGTEREDLARYMHVEGNRAKEPFVAINVASLPDSRRDVELFGDGNLHQGAAERARGGTLFLDHCDKLPTFLQERLFESLQAIPPRSDDPTRSRPRLVAATSKPIQQRLEAWYPAFAELFLTRQLSVPPLRSDARDVLTLAELFLSEMGSAPDGTPRLLSERAKRMLAGYAWPGNIRELRQVLESAAARAGNLQIAPRHLPDQIDEPTEPNGDPTVATLEEVEQRHIREVIQRVSGNRARAAQLLGIAPSTLYEKLRRYMIDY
jgi:transcriptional regulator with AAA-type ATPase domain/pSer/pThr/pTyr-binding forkhead associated (FHA) protein